MQLLEWLEGLDFEDRGLCLARTIHVILVSLGKGLVDSRTELKLV